VERSGHEQPWMSENQAKKALATAEKTKEELAMSEVARERCWGGGGGGGGGGGKNKVLNSKLSTIHLLTVALLR